MNLGVVRHVGQTVIPRTIRYVALLGALSALFCAAPATAAPFVNGEFSVSGLEETNMIVEGPDRNIWLTVHDPTNGNDVAKVDPKTGAVQEFNLPTVSDPRGIATAGEFLWITQEHGVAKFKPGSPTTTTTATTINAIELFHSIVAGPDGNLWVATNGKLIRFPPGDPTSFTEFPVANLSPRDIDVAGQGLVVGDVSGSDFLTVTAPGGVVTEHKVRAAVRGVAGSPTGQVGFSQPGATPELGLFAPPGPATFSPAPGLDPIGVALGPDGAFWAAEAFNTETATRFGAGGAPVPVTPGFARNSRPRQITAGPEGTLWVTLTGPGGGPGKVGRISGVEKPPTPPIPPTPPTPTPPPHRAEPDTTLLHSPPANVGLSIRFAKVKVKFSFSSPSAGASFQCSLRRLGPRKSASPASFTPCASPTAYRVTPGRYRFEVRAVLAGVADSSPAARGFKVLRVFPPLRHR